MVEKTLAIIKPDAVKKKLVGKIIQRIEDEEFKISGLKMLHLTKEEAQGFYIVHKDKHFYDTLRQMYGSSVERNATHGSDSPQTAEWEIDYFFKGKE